MTEKKEQLNSDNLQLNKDENVFTKEVKTISPFMYFLMSTGSAIWKGILWLVDLIVSMFTSIYTFLKMGVLGLWKGCVGIYTFFKRKCHQFVHNDIYGRLSYVFFGTSSFKNGQIANGIMYIVFEIVYIILFALFGAKAIWSIGALGPVIIREEIVEDEFLGTIVNKYFDGSSIIALLSGIVWVISLFVFIYVWIRNINSGYALYRINNFPTFRRITEETKEYSQKISDDAAAAFNNGINKKAFKKNIINDINTYVDKYENKQEGKYVRYLLMGSIDNAYTYLKANKRLVNDIDKINARTEKINQQREAKRLELKATPTEGLTDDEISKLTIKYDKFTSRTVAINAKRKIKFNKKNNLLRELDKRYSCFAEIQSTINNDKYGKFNFYFKNIADLNQDITFWSNYSKLLEVYNSNFDKNLEKNEENKEKSQQILVDFGEKTKKINEKYDAIVSKRVNIENQIRQLKVDYDNSVKDLKTQGLSSTELNQKMVEAKTTLVNETTRLNRFLYELPSTKSIKDMRKEEISEAKHSSTRDRLYLKTNFTSEGYAKQCVIDELVVNFKFDYKLAKYFAEILFKKEEGKLVPYTNEEIQQRIVSLQNEKAEFIANHKDKYVGKPKAFKDQLKGLLNENFHITILALPILGIILISIIPLIFSILIAFTDFSNKAGTLPPHQIHWIGLGNFSALFDPANKLYGSLAEELTHTVSWTFIWAIIATFSNYFLGIIVALMINKDGIKFKKFFRTIFVLTIAIPQFISLLSIAKLLKENGAIDSLFTGGLGFALDAKHVLITKVIIIFVNIWVGIPYTILSTTGILLNIPKDLYESSRVDGAGTVTQFLKITMPYILFVTGPYLITQFIGNFNNFNVIFFLTGGGPTITSSKLGVGHTDLLITFLYKVITEKQEYGIASTIGIFIFAICAFFSIVMYNKSGAIQQEDQFQ